MARRSYKGAAASTALVGTISAAATNFTVTSGGGAGYPTGGVGPFAVVVDPGTANEEKMLCASRSGDVFSGLTRGYDDTIAVTHGIGAVVQHILTAVDADEANAHVNLTSGVHGHTGAAVGTTDTQTLANKSISGSANTLSAIPQSAVTNLATDLATKLSAAAVQDAWEAILAVAPGTGWANALDGALAANWQTALQGALGTNWNAALAATLDPEAASVLAAMGTGWPAALAAALDADAASLLANIANSWVASLQAALGSGWQAAFNSALDTDAATVLASGGMAANWPTALAADPSGLHRMKTYIAAREGGFPVTASSTGEEDVVDRYVIAASNWARRVSMVGSCFMANTQTTDMDLSWYAGSTNIGRSQVRPTAGVGQTVTAVGQPLDLASGVSVTLELRVSRVSGSGIVTSSATDYTTAMVVVAPN